MLLSRLVQKDIIRHIGRGLYDLPRISGILKRPAPPNVDLAVKAIARRDRLKIAPDGIVAANQLGLTNAVPAKNAYITDGTSKTLKIGDRTVQFQHACHKIAQWIDCALSWLGKDAAKDPIAIDTLRSNTPDRVKADLMKGVDNLPVWMRSIVRHICETLLRRQRLCLRQATPTPTRTAGDCVNEKFQQFLAFHSFFVAFLGF